MWFKSHLSCVNSCLISYTIIFFFFWFLFVLSFFLSNLVPIHTHTQSIIHASLSQYCVRVCVLFVFYAIKSHAYFIPWYMNILTQFHPEPILLNLTACLELTVTSQVSHRHTIQSHDKIRIAKVAVRAALPIPTQSPCQVHGELNFFFFQFHLVIVYNAMFC